MVCNFRIVKVLHHKSSKRRHAGKR